ncbi:MAG: signal recognition particle receptor subunit alpha [Nanoarchaeota archaeon]
MLEKLSSILKKTTDKIANALFLDKEVVESLVKDLQRALIEADVNVKIVLELSEKLRKVAYDERIKGLEKKEHLIKVLHGELRALLGIQKKIELGKKNVFMMLGLYGAGKTTTISKIAFYYAKRGHKVCAVGLDVHRPAAAEQLKQACAKVNVSAFIAPEEKNPLKILKHYQKELEKYDIVLIDTAGRDALDSELIKEIKAIAKEAKPTETFLVMPADVGQTARKQASTFKEAVNITGVIITRMDSTAKAGGALTACAEAKAPVVFIGTGEKPHELEHFDPDAFLSRLLGMGDLKALLEKIESVTNQKELEKTTQNLKEGKFTLRDLQAQLETMENVGSMDKIMAMIPGLGQANVSKEAMEKQQSQAKRWKHAINSMTQAEVENPELLEKQTSRIARIAKGSGTTTSEIRALIKQYKLLKEMVQSQGKIAESGTLDQKTMMKLAKKFGRKMKGRF